MACERGKEPATLRRSLLGHALAAEQHRAALAAVLGLGARELLAVQHLAHAGELTPTQLGRRLQLSSGGCSTLVRRLEQAGCTTRYAHPTDRRSVRLQLTPEIQRRLSDALAPVIDEIDQRAGTLSPSAALIVQRLLDEVSELNEGHAQTLANSAEPSRPSTVPPALPPLWA